MILRNARLVFMGPGTGHLFTRGNRPLGANSWPKALMTDGDQIPNLPAKYSWNPYSGVTFDTASSWAKAGWPIRRYGWKDTEVTWEGHWLKNGEPWELTHEDNTEDWMIGGNAEEGDGDTAPPPSIDMVLKVIALGVKITLDYYYIDSNKPATLTWVDGEDKSLTKPLSEWKDVVIPVSSRGDYTFIMDGPLGKITRTVFINDQPPKEGDYIYLEFVAQPSFDLSGSIAASQHRFIYWDIKDSKGNLSNHHIYPTGVRGYYTGYREVVDKVPYPGVVESSVANGLIDSVIFYKGSDVQYYTMLILTKHGVKPQFLSNNFDIWVEGKKFSPEESEEIRGGEINANGIDPLTNEPYIFRDSTDREYKGMLYRVHRELGGYPFKPVRIFIQFHP